MRRIGSRPWLAGAGIVVVVLAVGGLLALGGGLGGAAATPSPSAVALASATPSASTVTSLAPTAEPTATPSPTPTGGPFAALDGMPTTAALAAREPLAVMIDDNAVARPQSGFSGASIVYQAPADGGEDRYMFVYQEGDAADLGPARSGRPYFVRWAAEYRAIFTHVGGDAKTLGQVVPSLTAARLIYNLDALSMPGFHRISSRVAPHNDYSSTARLREVAARYALPSVQPGGLATRPFSVDLPADQRPKSGSITVPYNTGLIGYTYDPASNAYLRSVAGTAQYDGYDHKRVTARNVVVLFMVLSVDPESEPGYHRPVLAQIGTGKAIVFHDGKVWQGTWAKASDGDLTRFYDASGKEVPLVRGRIFVQVVPTGTNVTWKAAP